MQSCHGACSHGSVNQLPAPLKRGRGVKSLAHDSRSNSQPTGSNTISPALTARHAATDTRTAHAARPLAAADIAALLRLPPLPPDPLDQHVSEIPEGTVMRAAAVLVPLVARGGQVNLLLTQRTEHLAAHPGQISFPGGRVEAADASRAETALRETEEEIGLPRARVSLLGHLPEYRLPTGFDITPVVGWIEAPFETRADPYEVADIFEIPLVHFIDPARYQRHEYHFNGRHRHYVAIPYEGRYIWGATAGMLLSFARMLTAGGATTQAAAQQAHH
jgi:8-oxo-dGTP pyrophosphatase MutT (NUDIX family)